MPFKEQVYSVLLVSSSEKMNSSLIQALPETDYCPVHIAKSISEAQRRISDLDYDIVIVNAPLPDDFGIKFINDVCFNRSSAAMLIVKNELYAEVYSQLLGCGALTLRKPVGTAFFAVAMDWLKATRERLRRFEKRTMSLEEKMSEIRLTNRAKYKLMEREKLTESDAHRYIQKMAMDKCVTCREIAQAILDEN